MAQAIEQAPSTARAHLSERAEEVFRGLWASLFFSGKAIGKSVMICSADRREGASTIACGLALAGSTPAGSDRVALVDLNLREPAIHRMIGARQNPGVAEVIVDGLAPESAAQRVNSGLDVYAIGNGRERRLEILRSDRLASFLAMLSDGYDRVLIDVAAVNHYPDAQVLAGVVKDVALVAHTDQTPREAVAQAKKRLEAGGGKLAGVVLNLRTYPIPGFLYKRV